jgi:hypothetical protein
MAQWSIWHDVLTSMTRALLFAISCFLGGLGGVLGSIVGNPAGQRGDPQYRTDWNRRARWCKR